MTLVIAIDGPAGSGKSTVAKAVAKRVGLEYLDTGAMYRAVALACVVNQVDVSDADAVVAQATTIDLVINEDQVVVNGVDATVAIRTPEITALVSAVAANPGVREELRSRQRAWAEERGGGVMEGRDIGTVVFPNAALKVYLTASIAERARRRAAESGQDAAEVEGDMLRRDEADSTRQHAPLAQANDAVMVDTTALSIEEVVEAIAVHVDKVRRQEEQLEQAPAESTSVIKAPAKPMGKSEEERHGRAVFGAPLSKASHSVRWIARNIVGIPFRPIFPITVVHPERFPASGPVVLAPSHRSNLDTPLIGLAFKRWMRFMAKDSIFRSPLWTQFIVALGGFPVRRGKLDRRALSNALEILERGEPLVVYPEGARQEGPRIKPMFEGAVWIAARANVSVVPLGIGGSHNAQPIGKKLPRPTKVVFVLGEPMDPPSPAPGKKRVGREELEAYSAELRENLQAVFDEANELAGTPNRAWTAADEIRREPWEG